MHGVAPTPSPRATLSDLTQTERRILQLIAGYKTNKEIAPNCAISHRTVETHRANMWTKLEIHGSHALMKFALFIARSCSAPRPQQRERFLATGRSGHAALPHLTRDPLIASAHLLLALQTIVSRNVDPLDAAVISIATMQAGTAANQIPGEAIMRGTLRTLRDATRDAVEQAIRRVAAGVAQSCDVAIEVTLSRGNPVTMNTPVERDLAAEAVATAGLPLRRDMAPAMTGEDFAWYLEQLRRVRLDRQRPGRRWPRAAQFGLRLQ